MIRDLPLVGLMLAAIVMLVALVVMYLYLRVTPEEEPRKFPKIELQLE